jgi:vancomycin resistance protein YoaR
MDLAIRETAGSVEITPIDPMITVLGQKVQITNGVNGVLLDNAMMEARIREAASNLDTRAVQVPTLTASRQLTHDQMEILQTRAEKLVSSSLTLVLDDEKTRLSGKEIVALLSTKGAEAVVDSEAVTQYVVGLGDSFNKEPQDARFAFEDGKVQEFAPGKDGVAVDIQSTATKIQTTIEKFINEDSKNETIEIAATRTPPQVTTDKVNELGIKERIGRGESYYAHSIPNRIFNVGLAATRANSALIAPGEEFSFNKVVGEVSGATGYREAYVISGGRTVLGDGGGVCQVSTTLFRGAMSAGLPITERWGHAYRVGYYEQNSKPGIDATVYAPSKDMRFKNDTPGHILVQTINDPKTLHLVVEIYGTSDGRVATVSEPKIWGIAPPPPDIIQEDPSLPTGTTKQVDWSAGGAKTSFEYKVVRNGETLQEKTFTTSYKPWANVYLKGTGQ